MLFNILNGVFIRSHACDRTTGWIDRIQACVRIGAGGTGASPPRTVRSLDVVVVRDGKSIYFFDVQTDWHEDGHSLFSTFRARIRNLFYFCRYFEQSPKFYSLIRTGSRCHILIESSFTTVVEAHGYRGDLKNCVRRNARWWRYYDPFVLKIGSQKMHKVRLYIVPEENGKMNGNVKAMKSFFEKQQYEAKNFKKTFFKWRPNDVFDQKNINSLVSFENRINTKTDFLNSLQETLDKRSKGFASEDVSRLFPRG